MFPLTYAYYWLALQRRKKGIYDEKTLSLLAKACSISDNSRIHFAYAKLQRDIHGAVSTKMVSRLEGALKKHSAEKNQNQRIRRLLLGEIDNTESINQQVKSDDFDKVLYQQDAWRQELLELLEDKSLAVIGNGTSLINSGLGPEIDGHDIICRFNRFPANSYDLQRDVGTKTNIWITSPEVFTENYPIPDSVEWVVLSGGDVRYTLQDWSCASQHLEQNRKIITLPITSWSDLVKILRAPPSAGLLWLYYLCQHKHLSTTLHTYGFDRTITKGSRYHITSHTFKPSRRHSWSKEKELFRLLVSSNEIQEHPEKTLGAFSKGLAKNSRLLRHLGSHTLLFKPSDKHSKSVDQIIAWGKKPNTKVARAYSLKHGLPYLSLEDGFIHSMSQGRLGAASWSLVIDQSGIFYDANTTSDLEQLINTATLNTEQSNRAMSCIAKITTHHITKYNNASLVLPKKVKTYKTPVLVLDQVDGDMSIPYAMATKETFQVMLDAAISENPESDVLIKVHPDVINGKRSGCISIPNPLPNNLHLLTDNTNPLVLMKEVNKVYVVSSQAGFEALMLNKLVICFGAPFYAGWGLTSDRFDPSLSIVNRRSSRPSLDAIFHAAYIRYSRYLDPVNKQPCEIEVVLKHIVIQYKYAIKNTGLFLCIGFTPWKKRFIKTLLHNPDNTLHFIKSETDARKYPCDNKTKLFIWSNTHLNIAKSLAKKHQASIVKLEDGFLRSVNLGSNYSLPSSLVFDDQGIYFDPGQPSTLESILSSHVFDAVLMKRARTLKTQIVSLGVSKYNLGLQHSIVISKHSAEQVVILVPGQVADDVSIELGCIDITTNLELLTSVRKANPAAYIIYKPHPDVVSGNRAGSMPSEIALQHCDQIIENLSLPICLNMADEVHTLTSLVGFEALLRGIDVHCYGLPFYSNWGLTHDRHILDRRQRQLNIDELVAGTLLLYPRYYDWSTQSYINAETVVSQLHKQSKSLADKKQQSIYSQKLSGYLNLFRALFTTYTK
ncbi:glycosyltransferase family 29 protein [Leucothrix arctica]|uniref:Beta-3-deoxy-D-manno-oct-2-ulosonic acid transferase n=1 Tax=Leucothrix arctica TaxID=1481894 RepID=A0A317CA40_9GAMM|nr:glycosyltransferase family 29 protein [Leucothrix arctica]PWQ95011.1 hypothetical protein DKT75_13840 [Leucothrix arctica]